MTEDAKRQHLPHDLTLVLPFPPSVNSYWRNAGRTLLSAKARKFHQQARVEILAQMAKRGKWGFSPFCGPVAVDIRLQPPDRKRRDIDNLAKAALDALTRCRIWIDDNLVHDLHLVWEDPEKPGRAVIRITLLDGGNGKN